MNIHWDTLRGSGEVQGASRNSGVDLEFLIEWFLIENAGCKCLHIAAIEIHIAHLMAACLLMGRGNQRNKHGVRARHCFAGDCCRLGHKQKQLRVFEPRERHGFHYLSAVARRRWEAQDKGRTFRANKCQCLVMASGEVNTMPTVVTGARP